MAFHGFKSPSATSYTVPSYVGLAHRLGQSYAKTARRRFIARPSPRYVKCSCVRKEASFHKRKMPDTQTTSLPSLPPKKVSPCSQSAQWFESKARIQAHDITMALDALQDDLMRDDWNTRKPEMQQALPQVLCGSRRLASTVIPAIASHPRLHKAITAAVDDLDFWGPGASHSEAMVDPNRDAQERILMERWRTAFLARPNSVKTRLRCTLLQMCGSPAEVLRALDTNLNGTISMAEFEQNLDLLKIDLPSISGQDDYTYRDLFKLLDASRDGVVDTSELLGIDKKERDLLLWQAMTTTEKWTSWCRRSGQQKFAGPRWNTKESKLSNAVEKFNERVKVELSKQKMLEHFRHGEHRPRLVAKFLPSDLDSRASIERSRKEYIAFIQERTRAIEQALRDLRDQHHELWTARTTFMEAMGQATHRSRHDLQSEKRQLRLQRQIESVAGLTAPNLHARPDNRPEGEELLNFFSEDHLDVEEREIRSIARKHDFRIGSVEFMRQLFTTFDSDGSGVVDKEEFAQCFRLLQGQHVSQQRIDECWRRVDTDQSGEVDFEELLVWYCMYFGEPTITGARLRAIKATKRDMMSAQEKDE